ncbi:hypothetical protein QR680_019146 [Steinernema hermaphroditum]|uniref:protein-serine/threonine phosphatase n=1 Tax=Steinernema hermaphroditum TaxID=289476 RepID=A0AA39HK39_9BILA|nr:hypothetical protein QR680_019146 [Steinernema hermaphroditum]
MLTGRVGVFEHRRYEVATQRPPINAEIRAPEQLDEVSEARCSETLSNFITSLALIGRMRLLLVTSLLLALRKANALHCAESDWIHESRPGRNCSGPPSSLCYVIYNVSSKTSRYGCALNMDPANNVCRGRSVDRCEGPMFRVHDTASICCCDSDFCNEPINDTTGDKQLKIFLRDSRFNKSAQSPSISFGGIIIGAICGVLLLGVVVIGAVAGYRRYQKKSPLMKTPKIVRDELERSALSCEPSTENRSDEKSRCDPSDMKPVEEKSQRNAIHIDCTEDIVPAQITEDEQNGLLKALKKQTTSKGILFASKRPMIEKVVAYGTSDDITAIGSVRQTNEDRPAESLSSISSNVADSLLVRMIRNGPRQFPFTFYELTELLHAATNCFAKEPSLLEVPVPCVVYGDIHGQYSDLHRWFNLNGWPHKTKSVFLGDFVDRGSHGIEVVALLAALKLAFPEQVFICRGNHEEESLNKAYSFYEEVCLRFPSSPETVGRDGPVVYSYFKKLFMQIPLAALIGGRILGMHGGISPKMESVDAIRRIMRPIDDFEVGSLACDIVWSDPDTDGDLVGGFRPNLDREPQHGIGQLFTAEAVKTICRKLKIDFIIRGHQAPLHGYALFADGYLMTLFSAPGYKGSTQKDVNMGACVEIQKDMTITIKQLKVSEKFRKNRVDDVERMKASRKLARRLRDIAKESKTDSCEKV